MGGGGAGRSIESANGCWRRSICTLCSQPRGVRFDQLHRICDGTHPLLIIHGIEDPNVPHWAADIIAAPAAALLAGGSKVSATPVACLCRLSLLYLVLLLSSPLSKMLPPFSIHLSPKHCAIRGPKRDDI